MRLILHLKTLAYTLAALSPRSSILSTTKAASSTMRMASTLTHDDAMKLSVLGQPLTVHGTNPVTGFHRDGMCSPNPMDPAEHTLAGVVTAEFLAFSKAQGNDLSTPRGGFPGLQPGCRWCLCVSRWKEAYLARTTHPEGDKIVPRVNLAGTSITALGEDPRWKVTMRELDEFKEAPNQS